MEKFKVLVVDDVPINIQAVSNLLKQEGYAVGYAVNGEVALELMRKNSYDLVLLDVMMPEVDGFEVCRKMKTNPKTKDVPVIFLTAKTDVDSIALGFDVGGIDYILKPFYSQELLARVKTQLRLKQQTQELKEINNTKDKFFSIIAHDLKNPFYGILSLGRMLKEKLKNKNFEETETYAELIFQSAQNGYSLLENLLEWSNNQIGKIIYQPEEIELFEIIRNTQELFQSEIQRKELHFSSHIPKNLFVYADKNMLKTVFRNLLSNSIKFTENGGFIKIDCEAKLKFVEINISDTGIGISQEDQDKLFHIDQSFSKPDTEQIKGSGLGLILCKEFIFKNKGQIWVKSDLEKGSEFTFTLPIYFK
ncbi:MAG: hybrid sensor histidine kinase/response regulator [Leptospiraceae bacterium]|nr:hybrid sensor histidine kinase/response regulator [Leptospiraceae bacterium]MCP5496170.1 hybrid sensor histidine kinase/response regulator [Leptospiraceae bacterium]